MKHEDHEKRIREALEAGPVQYACHADGDQLDEALQLYRAKVEALKAAAKPAAPDQSAA